MTGLSLQTVLFFRQRNEFVDPIPHKTLLSTAWLYGNAKKCKRMAVRVAYSPSCAPNIIPHNLLILFIVLKVNGSQSDKDERFKALNI